MPEVILKQASYDRSVGLGGAANNVSAPTGSGVYEIRNTANGCTYIGSSENLRRRKSAHFSQLKRGVHNNRSLQADYDLHGKDSFVWSVIEAVSDVGLLLETEQKHLDDRGPYYNVLQMAGSPLGMKHTQESKEKISVARKGSGNGMFGKKHSAAAIELITEASRRRKDAPGVRDALARGHGWNRGRPFSEETRRKMSNAKPKFPVERVCPTGAIKLYPTLVSVRADGFHVGHVGDCCKGRVKSHKGYVWRFAVRKADLA